MIPLSRARPRSITLFAIAFFGAALIPFIKGLLEIPDRLAILQRLYPAFGWSQDWVIVWLSAWLSIALIPIAMVWLSAVRFARWMVAFMSIAKLSVSVSVMAKGYAVLILSDLPLMASLLLGLFALAMLFTPASNRWFAREDELSPEIFE